MINIDCVKVFDMKQVWDELIYQVSYPEANHVLSDVWYQVRHQVWIQVRHKAWDQIIND